MSVPLSEKDLICIGGKINIQPDLFSRRLAVLHMHKVIIILIYIYIFLFKNNLRNNNQ